MKGSEFMSILFIVKLLTMESLITREMPEVLKKKETPDPLFLCFYVCNLSISINSGERWREWHSKTVPFFFLAFFQSGEVNRNDMIIGSQWISWLNLPGSFSAFNLEVMVSYFGSCAHARIHGVPWLYPPASIDKAGLQASFSSHCGTSLRWRSRGFSERACGRLLRNMALVLSSSYRNL